MPDGLICDEGIAPAISKEQSSADGVSQLTEFLTQKVNTALNSRIVGNFMKQALIFIYLVTSVYLNAAAFNGDVNYFSPTVAYGDSSIVVGGHVNVITGDFVDFGRDLVIPGPVPLSLERHYASSVFRQSGGPHHSWHFNYESSAIASDQTFTESGNKVNKIKICKLTVLSLSGGKAFFYKKIPGGENHFSNRISHVSYERGFSNTSQGIISGQTSLKNLSFAHENESEQMTLREGDGTQFFYSKKSKYELFVIDAIRSPNGNKTIYSDYQYYKSRSDKWFAPQLIKTTNDTGSQTFGQIKITYPKHEKAYQNYIYTSNHGRNVKYRFRVHKGLKHPAKEGMEKFNWCTKDKLCLESVESDIQPTITYFWENAGMNKNGFHNERYRIIKKSLPDNRDLEILYYSGGAHLNYKVRALKAPIGIDSRLITTYRFNYDESSRKTSVYNAKNCLTEYLYTNCHRLSAIIRYLNGEKFSNERFEWGKRDHLIGNLCLHWFENANGLIETCQSYAYDSNGNAVQETLSGNLTGENNKPIEIDFSELKPIDHGHESYTIYREYSEDGMNLLRREIDGPKTIEFDYVPGTNLISEKRTIIDHHLIQENFEYDANKVLIKKIYRDGIFNKITKIIPSAFPIIGLPEIVEEFYEENDQHHLIQRTVTQYNCDGKPIRIQLYDANGDFSHETVHDYDSHGNLLLEIDPLGQKTHYEYDVNDNLIRESGPDINYFKTYEYDYSNRLVAEKIHSSNGKTYIKRIGYDLLSNKIWESDIYDNRTNYLYDDLNRQIQIHYPDGSKKSLEYDIFNNPIREENEKGSITRKKYNSRNQVIEEIFPDGTSEKFLYNLQGLLIEKTGKNGARTSYVYDGFGRVLEEKIYSADEILLSTKSFTYNAAHLLTETDLNGITTYYDYDGAGRLIHYVKGGLQTHYVYDPLGRLKKTIEDSRVTVYEYDSLNRIIEQRIEDADGIILSKVGYTYDCNGNKTHVFKDGQAGLSQTITDYDSLNRPIRVIDPEGHVTLTQYDDITNQIEQTDPNGIISVQVNDVRGRLVNHIVKDPFGKIVQNCSCNYDLTGNLIEQIDVALPTDRQVISRWEYDACSREVVRLEAYGSPEQKVTATSYNSSGLKASVTKPDGVIIHYRYDGLDRLISRSSSDNSLHETYRYDANGNLLRSQNELTGVYTERTYDDNDHLIAETLANGLQLSYSYDGLGRIAQMRLPDQSAIEYTYDAGFMRSVKRLDAKKQVKYTHSYDEYDLSRRLCAETLIGNVGKITHQHDRLGRPTETFGKNYKTQVPMGGYDPSGNLLKWNLEDPHGIVYNSYVYDALNQLIEETGNASHSYQCDALSNRMKMDENAYEVNRLNQITQQNETNYQYDLNGNRISKTTPTGKVTYQYDALNRLIQVSTNDSTISYAYDTFNRRISRTDDDKTTYFLYREMEEIGSYVNNRIEDLKILGEPHCVAIEIQDKHYATTIDLFGNITALICPNTGETITTYRFGAFGEETHFGDVHSPWRYQQKRHDPFTDLIYFGYRDYDKEIGAWSTPDPLGFADGPNLYAYVHHNPIMLHDPEGTFSLPSFSSSIRSEGNINNSNQFLWREHKPAENAKSSAFRSFYRGFVDDTTWGLSDWALGEHESGSWGNRVCYGIGTGASLAVGLFYGSTEAKVIYGGLKATKWVGGKVFQGGKYLWRGASHKATNFFKPATVINSTGVISKTTKSTMGVGEKYFSGTPISFKESMPIWTNTKSYSSAENAFRHWKSHAMDFPYIQNAKQYVEATRNFTLNRSIDTLKKIRPNGDVVFFNPSTNVFAIVNKQGVPRTMYKPNPNIHRYKTNLEYFYAQ